MPVNDENLAVLSSRYGINAMVNFFNGELGNDMNNIVIESFYNNYLLDAMELAADNYVFQSYAKPYYVPEGYEKKKLKRYGSLTEHTTPLPEGIPPKSDKTKVESFEATFNTYGRYMEFTDRVSYMTIDPIIAMYTDRYGKLAARTKERLARNEMLHSTSILVPQSAGQVIANGVVTGTAADVTHMMLEDVLTFNDYRVQVARMKRMLVEPVEGNNFHLIGSPEVKFDLITDPMVRDFYGKDSGITAYQTDELPVLFNIKFKETMLDDYAYGYELANPGELDSWDSTTKSSIKILRIYATKNGVQYYLNVPEKVGTTKYRKVVEARLSDGSYIPEKVEWDVNGYLNALTSESTYDSFTPASVVVTNGVVTNNGKSINVAVTASGTSGTAGTAAFFRSLDWKQLPFHRCILIGADALIETGIEGHTAPKMYVKPLGSAGVLDPIDQRQSIGFKIDTIGYSLLKPESCVVCYTIPTGAVDTNDIMYTYEGGQPVANTHSYSIRLNGGRGTGVNGDVANGRVYNQLQVEEGYNMYGKVNPITGNVDTDRDGVPGVQAPYYAGLNEFGATPERTKNVGMTGEQNISAAINVKYPYTSAETSSTITPEETPGDTSEETPQE